MIFDVLKPVAKSYKTRWLETHFRFKCFTYWNSSKSVTKSDKIWCFKTSSQVWYNSKTWYSNQSPTMSEKYDLLIFKQISSKSLKYLIFQISSKAWSSLMIWNQQLNSITVQRLNSNKSEIKPEKFDVSKLKPISSIVR